MVDWEKGAGGNFVGFLLGGGGVYGGDLFLENFFACGGECSVGDVCECLVGVAILVVVWGGGVGELGEGKG